MRLESDTVSPDGAVNRPGVRLNAYLTRLILTCVVPLMLFACYLSVDSLFNTRSEQDQEAVNLINNVGGSIDRDLNGRVNGLQLLAASPLLSDTARLEDLYVEAQGFHRHFGGHVILADTQMHMLFNTRTPFGTSLPDLPTPTGKSAVSTAIETGRPAVGDAVFGPIAKEPLVAIAVPVMQNGKVAYVFISMIETRQFQQQFDHIASRPGWAIDLLDGTGELIARHAPGAQIDAEIDKRVDEKRVSSSRRFSVKSTVSLWSVTLDIPRDLFWAKIQATAVILFASLFGATLAGFLGGKLAGRRLAWSVASLVEAGKPGIRAPNIIEIERVREALDEAAKRRDLVDAELHESELRFRATFDQAAVGIAHVATDGHWLRVNQKLCDIVGYRYDELLTRTFQEITHPADLDADLEHVRQMLSSERATYAMEKRYLRKDGGYVWCNLTVSLVCKPDGTPDYFISVVEDIQPRKEAEAILAARTEAMNEAQRLAGLGKWLWDIQTDIHSWSEQIYLIYGRDPNLPPAIYPEVKQYFTDESWDRLSAAVASCMEGGPAYECDAEVVRPDGSRRWILARGEATRNDNGAIINLHGTVQDITRRKEEEERLRQHAKVWNNTQEGIVITDAQCLVVDANPAFERISEYSLDEIRGEHMRFIQSGRHDRSFYLGMWQTILQTGAWQGEIWNRRKGGDIYLEWVNIGTVRDDKGKVANYIATTIDMSRMQHAQSEIERLAHHDGLTNLPNRLLLGSRLQQAIERQARHGGMGAVLFLDLDRFKQVNDTYGHQAGDQLLQGVAERLKGRLRDVDTLARLGGDEFVIVLEEIAARDDAAKFAKEIIRQLQMPFSLALGVDAHIGGSVGIAIFPQDGGTIAELIEHADQALYASKNGGRGIYRFYSEDSS